MSDNDVTERARLYSAMNAGKPFASYKKTILAKVYVNVLDTFSDKPMGLLLVGDPRKNEPGCIIDVWSEKEEVFFKKMNYIHLGNGTIIPYTRVEAVAERTFEESTDEELVQLLNSKYFTLQNKLNTVNTIPVLFRLLDAARIAEKSEKIIKLIESRISEVQTSELKSKDVESTE